MAKRKEAAPSDEELARAAVDTVLSNGMRQGGQHTGKRAGLQAAQEAFERATAAIDEQRRRRRKGH